MLATYDDLPKRAWWRVVSPVGRKLGDLDSDPLMLWSFQSEAAYRVLAETGVIRGDPAFADADLGFVCPWMQAQANERLSTTGDGLLWFWVGSTRRSLFGHAKGSRGEVLLRVQIPADQVLLSDYHDWHLPLNGLLNLPQLAGEDHDEWSARTEPILDDWIDRHHAAGLTRPQRNLRRSVTFNEWPSDLRAEANESWQSILDRSTWSSDACIQGVAHAIRADQVVNAVQVRRKSSLIW